MLHASNARISDHMGGAFVGGGTGSMLKLKRVGDFNPSKLQYDSYKTYSISKIALNLSVYKVLKNLCTDYDISCYALLSVKHFYRK